VDPASHTVQVRLGLPRGAGKIAPGAFARVHLPVAEDGGALTVPLKSVVKRTELRAVYVQLANGRFALRHVRLGPVRGERVVVLAGLVEGERVALDPVGASRH
jgi:hypothetical protein